MGGANTPFAFGGMDNTELKVRAVILADSIYKQAVCSILKDTARDFFKMVNQRFTF